ncbi:MAG TPA: hypothetical protein VMW91_07440 [Desulfosporosinus sp.]|nr:hypothetical protein [Desulfosporosinus sp.]
MTLRPGLGSWNVEFPLAIFKNEQGAILTVSRVSSNLQYTISEDEPINEALANFKKMAAGITQVVNDVFECGTARMGIVVIGKLPTEQPGIDFIRGQYLDQNQFRELLGGEIHWYNRIDLFGQKINRWIRLKAEANEEGIPNNFVQIIVDTNHIGHLDNAISTESGKDFINACLDDIGDNFERILNFRK